MILAIVTVLALGGGTAAWFISQRPVVVATNPQVNNAPDTGVVDAGGQPQVVVAPTGTGAEDAGPGTAMTTIHVETRPEGASVQVANTTQICGPTPCNLEVISGVPIVLQARHGLSVGDLEITPQGESTTVQMALVRRTGAGVRPTTSMTGNDPSDTRMTDGQTSGMTGDLKVPDIFR